jgi:hypothetical protein
VPLTERRLTNAIKEAKEKKALPGKKSPRKTFPRWLFGKALSSPPHAPVFQGAGPQKKVGYPRGGWVGHSTKKRWGQIYFPDIFYRVFELPSPRNAQKVIKKSRKKIDFGFLVEFFVNFFRRDCLCKTFLQNVFGSVF